MMEKIAAFLAAALLSTTMPAGIVRAAAPPATAVVHFREVDRIHSIDAFVEAVRQSTVSAQVPGRVVEIGAEVGSPVKKGQMLMKLDSRELTQQALGNQVQLAREQANLDNARRRYEQARAMYAQKFITQSALEAAQADFDMAQAQLRATQANQGASQAARDITVVTAPYDQVISERHIGLGEMALPGKPLITGFDPSALRAVAIIPADLVASIRRSRGVQIEFPKLGQRIEVRVITWLPAEDRSLGMRVRLDLPPAMQGAHPGALVRAHFVVGRAKKLVMPETAALRRGEGATAYVLDKQGVPRSRQVLLGDPTGDGAIEVLAGVSSGDKVVIDPAKAGLADPK